MSDNAAGVCPAQATKNTERRPISFADGSRRSVTKIREKVGADPSPRTAEICQHSAGEV